MTVVFCDLAGSTALGDATDPEVLARAGALLERMKRILESHGGAVEKFIGDAVMAVFGVPGCTRTTPSGRCRAAARCGMRCPSSAYRHGWG